jgi:multiple sugar transport system substrate-binding protein
MGQVLAACGSSLPREAADRAVVQIWSGWVGDEERAFEQIIDLFNQSQNDFWAVNSSTIEDDTRIVRAVTAGTPPDVFFLWNPYLMGVFAELKAIHPLTDRFGSSGLREADYVDGALEFATLDGELYALPFLVDVAGLFYSRQLFREAGLDPARPPRTLADLLAYTEALTRFEDGRLRRMGFEELGGSAGPGPETLALFGAEFYGPGGLPQFDHPSCVRALDSLRRFYALQGGGQAIAAFRAGFGEYTSPSHQFFTHKIAMYSVGQWWPNLIAKYAPDMDCGVAAFPSDVHPNGVTVMGGNFACLPRDAQNSEGGWEFLRWTQTPEAQLAFCKVMYGMPNIRESLASPEIRGKEKPWNWFGALADACLNAHVTFFRPSKVSGIYEQEIRSAIQFAVRETKTPEEACQDAQARILKAWNDLQDY